MLLVLFRVFYAFLYLWNLIVEKNKKFKTGLITSYILLLQGFISTIKGHKLAIYNHNHVLGQLVLAANQLKDTDQHTFAKNEVKLVVCLYDMVNGEFWGLQKWLAYIISRVNEEECFFLPTGTRKRDRKPCIR